MKESNTHASFMMERLSCTVAREVHWKCKGKPDLDFHGSKGIYSTLTEIVLTNSENVYEFDCQECRYMYLSILNKIFSLLAWNPPKSLYFPMPVKYGLDLSIFYVPVIYISKEQLTLRSFGWRAESDPSDN